MEEPIAGYFDKELQRDVVKVAPGAYFATASDVVMVTVLGSCVAACLWDARRRIGGMNHFMLPGPGDSARLGIYAMEVLINRMLKCGADRRNLVHEEVPGVGK